MTVIGEEGIMASGFLAHWDFESEMVVVYAVVVVLAALCDCRI